MQSSPRRTVPSGQVGAALGGGAPGVMTVGGRGVKPGVVVSIGTQ
jgi:hypothetical protein